MLPKNSKKISGVIFLASLSLLAMPFMISTAQEAATSGGASTPVSPERESLEKTIESRTKELEKINKEIMAAQENIRTTTNQRKTLQQELKKINYNVKQLQLGIKADEVGVQKLELEVRATNLDIQNIEDSITDKQLAIKRLIQILDEKTKESLLVTILKSVRLSEAVLASQAASDLSSQLALDVEQLRDLRGDLTQKVGELSDKKSEISFHQKNLLNRKVIIQDQENEKRNLLVQTKDKEGIYQKQLSELEKQQEKISDEIGKIEDELRARFDASLLPAKRPGVFAWPVTLVQDGGLGRITQHFGEISKLYRGKPHNGLDVGAPLGTPVLAAEDGKVIAVDDNDLNKWSKYQYGKYVLVRHANNLTTLYAHLSQQLVSNGMDVKRGAIIGYSGKTGYATGPHLHFGVYWAPSVLMKSVPPAKGLVPVGVIIKPEDYL